MILLPLLTLVLYGPSHYGKTSFIQRLATHSLSAPSIRESSFPSIYSFNLTWPGESSIQPISILDFPGLEEIDQRQSNALVKEPVKLFVSLRKDTKVDAFLLFNSLAESSTKVKRTFREFSNVFGDVTPSVLFVLSKADIAGENAQNLKKTVISDCDKLGVRYVEWTSEANKEAMPRQMNDLRTKIRQLTPVSISDVQVTETAVTSRAEYVRELGRFLRQGAGSDAQLLAKATEMHHKFNDLPSVNPSAEVEYLHRPVDYYSSKLARLASQGSAVSLRLYSWEGYMDAMRQELIVEIWKRLEAGNPDEEIETDIPVYEEEMTVAQAEGWADYLLSCLVWLKGLIWSQKSEGRDL